MASITETRPPIEAAFVGGAIPKKIVPSNFEAVASLKKVTEKHGRSMAQFSLA